MLYLDTSVLVSALTNEVRSEEIYLWLDAVQEPAAVSDWTLTEFAAALSGKLRGGSLKHVEWRAARRGLTRLVTTGLESLAVEPIDFSRAAEFASDPDLGLRGGDALHLAVVERTGVRLSTLDKGQANAAHQLGLPAELL